MPCKNTLQKCNIKRIQNTWMQTFGLTFNIPAFLKTSSREPSVLEFFKTNKYRPEKLVDENLETKLDK